MNLFQKSMIAVAMTAALSLPIVAQTPAAAPAAAPAKKTAAPKAPATPAPTAAQIADAKAKGMVWVNTSSKKYHKDGANYGTTKHGQFMTEADAIKAGNVAAKESPIGKKKAAAAPAPKM